MNVCFRCQKPVPGDWAVHVSARCFYEKDRGIIHDGEMVFHPECAREFAFWILDEVINQGPRGHRMKLREQVNELRFNWFVSEPDYAKPTPEWWKKAS